MRDWFEWQWSRDYHQFKEELRYDNMLSADKSRRLHYDARSIELLLGKVPPKRNHPWKSTRKMLEYLHQTSKPEDALRFYRWFIKDVSQYVHISSSYAPSPELTTWFTEISVITTLCKAMGLCRDKLFIDTPAGEIATLCDKTLLDMAQMSRAAAKRTTGVSMSSVIVRADWPGKMSYPPHGECDIDAKRTDESPGFE